MNLTSQWSCKERSEALSSFLYINTFIPFTATHLFRLFTGTLMPSHKLKQRVWILSSLPYHSSPTRVLVPAYLILSSWPQISPPCIRLDSPPCTAVNYFLFHMAMLQALQNRSFLLNFLASQKNCLPKEAVMGEAPLFW